MTVKKAIGILDWWINYKKQSMEELLKKWNYNPEKPTDVEKLLIETTGTELYNLEIIRAQLIPNCKHLKKYQDKMKNGTLYCMNCNMDL